MIKRRSPTIWGTVKMHGGKGRMLGRIYAEMPDDTEGVEDRFGGGGCVGLNAPDHLLVTYNDRNAGLYSIMHQLHTQPAAFLDAIRVILYDRGTFEKFKAMSPYPAGSLHEAVRAYVVRRMARGGIVVYRDRVVVTAAFAWSERTRGGRPGDLNAWENMKYRGLERIAERLHRSYVRITNLDDHPPTGFGEGPPRSPKWLRYRDPPYLNTVRTHQGTYGDDEFTPKQHEQMLEDAKRDNCYSMISGYDSEMYNDHLKGWRKASFDLPNNSGQGKTKNRRVEVLYMNY